MSDAKCSECGADWRKPDGLLNVSNGNGPPDWRCADHRKPVEKSPHRLDLREAIDRYAQAFADGKAQPLARRAPKHKDSD